MPSKILGIDSSDDFLSVGLAGQSGIIISRSTEPGARNKNVLHRFLGETLGEAGVSLSEIDGVAVALGPGSFTGLRVGLAAAKGICWSLKLPLMGVSSLAAIAIAAEVNEGRIVTIKDAKREEFYFAGYLREGLGIQQVIPESAGTDTSILELIGEGFLPVGPGMAELGKRLPNLDLGPDEGFNRQMLGGAVAVLGLEMALAGKALEVSSVTPNYIRTPRPREWNQ